MNFENTICNHCKSPARILDGRKKCICSYCGNISYPKPKKYADMSWSEINDYCQSIIKESPEYGFDILESYAKTKKSVDIWYSLYCEASKKHEKTALKTLENIVTLSRDTSNKLVRKALSLLFEAYYFEKLCCAKNTTKAFEYLLPLAQSPYAGEKILYNIGYMYYYGEGTAANTDQALYYMRAAAAQGHYDAKRFVEEYEHQSYLSSLSTTSIHPYTPTVPDTTEYTGYTGETKKKHEELDDLSGNFWGTDVFNDSRGF